MSKKSHPRRLKETEAMAGVRMVRVSPRKLNLVAQLIRGKSASAALAELTFTQQRIAQDVRKVLQAAIANAENNHQLDVDRPCGGGATVGKSFVMKRFRLRAHAAAQLASSSPWSKLTVVVREREETA
jgi:large subunit ribosomal protein L22